MYSVAKVFFNLITLCISATQMYQLECFSVSQIYVRAKSDFSVFNVHSIFIVNVSVCCIYIGSLPPKINVLHFIVPIILDVFQLFHYCNFVFL